jgi:hypothetical protein
MSMDGATFAVFCPKHEEGGAIYRHLNGKTIRLNYTYTIV